MDPATKAMLGALVAILLLVGIMCLYPRRRPRVRERADNERLGVRISDEIERILRS